MPYLSLKRSIYDFYAPVLALYDVLPQARRKRIESLLTVALGIVFALGVLAFAVAQSAATDLIPAADLLIEATEKIYGAFLILLAARFCFTALEAFHRSYYFRGLAHVLDEGDAHESPAPSYEVATIVHTTPDSDLTAGFAYSFFGDQILMRLGITPDEVDDFLERVDRNRLRAEQFMLERERSVTLPVYAQNIGTNDKEFARFLFARGIQIDDLVGAATWMMHQTRRARQRERWYSRDALGRIPGLGKQWSYGVTPRLKRYAHDIVYDDLYRNVFTRAREAEDEVDELEAVLARARQANALLIGEAGSGMRETLALLARSMREGDALPPLEDKRLMLFDLEALIASMREKTAIESELRTVLQEAQRAGNIILALEHIDQAIESARRVGVNLLRTLVPFLESTQVQCIATTTPTAWHQTLSQDKQFMQYFNTVSMHDVQDDALVRLLEQRAGVIERREGVLFTYQSLTAIVAGGDRYFPDAVMPDKAFDLMEALVPLVMQKGRGMITAADVEEIIEQQTGIPTGAVGKEEQEALLRLEETLHERVIGQERAVAAIAGALRRARAGVGNPDRPVGSFLFLGPTGVGKTETAKALAEAYFGDENAMHRLDMSEYRGAEALSRLLGGGPSGGPGRLASMLREHPYALLLLDEFEKTEPDVHDLFLQLLDEGEFTDAAGRPVNAHNVIIIATSNAAADLIWRYFKQGEDPAAHEADIIDAIIERGELKPELLNRFDGVIVFHPVDERVAHDIARLQLVRLAGRLHERGVDLVVSDELVRYVATEGYNPEFGARPMNRLIQDKIEQVIADKIIRGEIERGETVELAAADLADL